jgi:Putative zinc-finger
MSHLDEGTLHALLDGELDLAEVSEVQKHLGGCVSCGSRLQEVKQVLAESHRLVGALEVPLRAPRQAAPEPPRTASPPPPPRHGHEQGAWDEPPVLLVPDPIDASLSRRKWLRRLSWAAVIAVVAVGGNLATNALRPSRPLLPERDLTSAAPAVPPAVVSEEESRRPESTLAVRSRAARPSAQTRSPAPTPAPSRARVAEQPAPAAGDQSADTTALVQESAVDSESLAMAKVETDSVSQLAAAAGLAAESASNQGNTEAGGDSRGEDELATRRAAAAALAELDRERVRQRANAATAALPPPARPDVEPVSEPAPRPPTLEQRAQIYLRIGLDEAVRQLGGPVHVIEGMTPELIGLTRSQIIPGSATNRPVVRVVYQDARGRMILLDQQRMEAGQQAPTSGSLRWAIGDVMLYLRGEPSAEVLRTLQARVR